MNYIVVTENELNHYIYKTNRNNVIFDFWRSIIKKMPSELIDLVNARRTDLVHVSEGEFKLKGYKPYIFKAQNAPESLRSYLDKYVVYVNDNSGQTFKWRNDIEKKLMNKEIKGRKVDNSTKVSKDNFS